ncbi:MAG: hypothetical protein NTZ48_07095 [Candidatus Omnitrophica bacterium]|nr:hypothetical protein [Candidatus Omnitrophota bacterium]
MDDYFAFTAVKYRNAEIEVVGSFKGDVCITYNAYISLVYRMPPPYLILSLRFPQSILGLGIIRSISFLKLSSSSSLFFMGDFCILLITQK